MILVFVGFDAAHPLDCKVSEGHLRSIDVLLNPLTSIGMVDICIRAFAAIAVPGTRAISLYHFSVLVLCLSRFRFCLSPYRSPHVSPCVYLSGQTFYFPRTQRRHLGEKSYCHYNCPLRLACKHRLLCSQYVFRSFNPPILVILIPGR
jgi:hypothetical protein